MHVKARAPINTTWKCGFVRPSDKITLARAFYLTGPQLARAGFESNKSEKNGAGSFHTCAREPYLIMSKEPSNRTICFSLC